MLHHFITVTGVCLFIAAVEEGDKGIFLSG